MPDDLVRRFPAYDILSVTHGLPIDLAPGIAILAYLTKQPMDPVSSIRASQICTPWLVSHYPQLATIAMPQQFAYDRDRGTPAEADYPAMDSWAAEIGVLLGADERGELPVPPLPDGQWNPRPLVDEVLDHTDPSKVWIVGD